ncbi:MAG: hypothetical protein CL910_04340 [Deltaproteobacteria bacterium]|nr:hypothetical protein [Deltaproteobacteria bacterium]
MEERAGYRRKPIFGQCGYPFPMIDGTGRRLRWIGLPALLLSLGAITHAEPAPDPVVAETRLRGGTRAGAVFFLPAPGEAGAVAVGAAHSFDRTRLAESVEIGFHLPERDLPVARSSRYWARPGKAYHAPGGTMREDHIVFALEEAPREIQVLQPAAELPAVGARVEIVGLGGASAARPGGPRPVTPRRLVGTVVRSAPARIEVDLASVTDLRGWGGAPVVDTATGRVVGLLQAAWPAEGGLRTGVGPIGGVVAAIATPLDGGVGRLFASLAPRASAANSPGARRRATTGSPHGERTPERTEAMVLAATRRAERDRRALGPVSLRVAIDHPAAGATVGEAGHAFLAGHAVALRGNGNDFDLVIVVDTSGSTLAPTGVDVDGDGRIGEPREDGASSDPGDSILASEVAAAARVMAGLDPGRTRVAIVSFSGQATLSFPGARAPANIKRAAITVEPLTSDYQRIRRGLGLLQERGGFGLTHMAAGIDLAMLELLGLPGALSAPAPDSRKIVLFFTDGQPTLPVLGSEAENVRAVLGSASRARRAGIRIHSFAIGPEALAGPVSTVEMAAVTGGLFTPVRPPGELVRFVETVSFAAIREVELHNLTTGRAAHQVRVHADGSWDGLVPLVPGENWIEVTARSELGSEARERIRLEHVPEAGGPAIPAELVSKRGELLRGRLAALESERVEAMRRELTIEIDRERAAARKRAAEQLKVLEIEVDRDAIDPAAPPWNGPGDHFPDDNQ